MFLLYQGYHYYKYRYVTAPKDRFTLKNPSKEEKERQKGYEFYRIIIIPSPRYTQAAHNVIENKDLSANKYGELIEGKIRIFHSEKLY